MEIKGICKRYRRAPYPVRRGIRLGFVCQIGLYLTAGLYALLAMPETRQPEKKTGGRWPVREANPFLSLVRLRHIEPWQTAVFWSILIAACGGWMFESAFNYSISAFFSFSPLFNGVLKCGVGILNALVGGWRYKTIGSAGNDTRPIAPGRGAVYGGELVECMQYRSCNSVFSLQCVFSIDKLFKSPASPGAAHNKQSKFTCRGIDGIV